MVIGVRLVTEELLVLTLLRLLDVVYCAPRQGTLFCVSVHQAEIGYRLNLGVELGWAGVPPRGSQ